MNPSDDLIFSKATSVSLWDQQVEIVTSLAKNRVQSERLIRLLESHNQILQNPEEQVFNRSEEVFQKYTSVAVTADVEDDLLGTNIDQYRVIEKIGEGGMGLVYRAQQTKPIQREVALKLLKPGMDSHKILSRFEVEKQVLQQMKHPGITTILDAGIQPNGRPYFAMELIENGKSIVEYAEERELDVWRRLELVANVCSVIEHAHRCGVIHRDLKPSNILVTTRGDESIVKVIDFGIAKAVSPQFDAHQFTTNHDDCMGTFAYMSPEHSPWINHGIDTRSDVYSLGMVLVELLVGQLSPELTTRSGWFKMVQETGIRRCPSSQLQSMNDETVQSLAEKRGLNSATLKKMVSGELDWICSKAVEIDKEERYQSVAEFREDLERFIAGHPVNAAKPSLFYRGRKFVARNKVISFLSAAFVFTILTSSVLASWLAYRAIVAEQSANQRLQHVLEVQQELREQRQHAEKERLRAVALNRGSVVDKAFLTATHEYYEALKELSPSELSSFRKIDTAKLFSMEYLSSADENLAVKGDWSWVVERGRLKVVGEIGINHENLTSARISELVASEHTHADQLNGESLSDIPEVELAKLKTTRACKLRFQKLALKEMCRHLPKTDPLLAEVMDNCAQQCLQNQQYDDAIKFLRDSITIWRNDKSYLAQLTQAELFLAFCLRAQGEIEEANQLRKRAVDRLGSASLSTDHVESLKGLVERLDSH